MSGYRELLDRLFKVSPYGKVGLSNSERLHDLLGKPTCSYETVHIAGTNGKGSVAIKIAKGLQLSGRRTGLFISPHLSSFTERISINGEYISEDDVVDHLWRLFSLIEGEGIPATFFEIVTAFGYLYFAEKGVDVAVIETGLGGRFDPTNIIMPVLSVITSIGMDHNTILGNTLEEIAFEKAGIIKPGIPVVLGPNASNLGIEEMAAERNSPCMVVSDEFVRVDDENSAVAGKALDLMSVPCRAVHGGISVRQPCRFEHLKYNDVDIIIDVAHNVDGLRRLFSEIGSSFSGKSLRVVFGFTKGKSFGSCLDVVTDNSSDIHLVEASNGRGVEASILSGLLSEKSIIPSPSKGTISSTVLDALSLAKRNNQILIVCGSCYIMGEVRQALGYI